MFFLCQDFFFNGENSDRAVHLFSSAARYHYFFRWGLKSSEASAYVN